MTTRMTRRALLHAGGLGIFVARAGRAAAAAPSDESLIELPAGDITTPVVLTPSMRVVRGAGIGRTNLVPPATIVFDWQGGTAAGPLTISDLSIWGAGRTGIGIQLRGNLDGGDHRISDVHIERVHCTDLAVGVHLFCCVNTWIGNCKMITCGTGLLVEHSADTDVKSVKTQLCRVGTALAEGIAHEPWEEGFTADALIDNGSDVGLEVEEYNYVSLSNCYFTSTRENAVTGRDSANVQLIGGAVSNTRDVGSGVVVGPGCARWLLQGLEVDNCTAFGVALVGGRNHIVSGCVFPNNRNVDIYLAADRCMIANNICESGFVPWSIYEAAGTGNVIENNLTCGEVRRV